jgi:GNAT superfamily N-acetyltransferase
MTVASSVTVREALEEDLPRILVLLYQASQSSSHPAAAPEELTERHHQVFRAFGGPFFHVLVLEVEGEILGTLHLYLVPSISRGGAPWAIVEHVAVDDTQRSKGYGEIQMNKAIGMAREVGACKVSLGSNVRRVASHRFYERLGFVASQKGFVLPLE